MKTAAVNRLTFSDNGARIDASFHLSDGIAVKRSINASPYQLTTVGELAKDIFYGNRAKRVYVNKRNNGIPFLSSSDILAADLDSVKLASSKYTPCVKQLRLDKDWILVSRSGTIGNTAWSGNLHAQKLASEHVIRIIPNDILRGGCLYAYLSSKQGHLLLTQGTFGAVIQHIEPDFVASIPVPLFPNSFQTEVNNLIIESSKLRDDALSARDHAIKILSNKIENDFSFRRVFNKNIRQIGFSWAAYNNNDGVDTICNSYSNRSFMLEDKAESIFAPPLFKHIYLQNDNGYPFMTGSELTRYNMRYYRWLSPKGVKDISDYVVKEGTLLLYKSGTTDGGILGNVFIADETQDGCCLSDHVIRINMPEKKLSYWTYAFLRTRAGVHLLQSLATGTMIPFITPDRVAKLRILNPDEDYDTVTALIEEYIKLISLSKLKENEAISLVEDEIEKWNN